MPNDYSRTWFELFLESIEPAQTEREIEFLARLLPQRDYKTILDLCCGHGRHASRLAERGYLVTGLDRDSHALAVARAEAPPGALYIEGDMRHLEMVPGTFDAVLIMWQSFGYFDEVTNTDILKQIGAKLRSGGRMVLDIYNRAFFEQHQGVRPYQRGGQIIATETKTMEGNRLTVHLDYGPIEGSDTFNWQLYTPEEIAALAEQLSFTVKLVCSNFNEATPPSQETPRIQFVLEKAAQS